MHEPDQNTAQGEARREALRRLTEELLGQLPSAALPAIADAAAALPDWRVAREATDLGPAFEAAVRRAYEAVGGASAGTFSAALVAGLAVDLPERLVDRRLSPDVAAQVPPALDRLLAFLPSADLTDYRWGCSDFLLKDLRLVAGLTLPVGAGIVDLRGVIGRRLTLGLARQGRSVPAVAALARGRGLEPWFSFHTEVRHLEEFDEPGWDRAYLRMAALLRQHPEVHGITAAGWLYDPQTTEVAPRLAHLHQRPLERGAVLVPGRTGQVDIDNAIAASSTRRRLYEAGEYVPVPHAMLWPRRQLLSWAGTRAAAEPR